MFQFNLKHDLSLD